MKYIFDLGDYEKNVEAFKKAVTILNDKYGYPNDMGTKTASDMYIHPDKIKVAMDIPDKNDIELLEGGEAFEEFDPSWDESVVDQKIAKDLAQEIYDEKHPKEEKDDII